jgi:hypothetical protein
MSLLWTVTQMWEGYAGQWYPSPINVLSIYKAARVIET